MRNVINSIAIATTPERAIHAFLDPDLLQGWWGVERSLVEAQSGGPYTLAWGITNNGIQYISTGIVQDYQPGQRLLVGCYVYLNPERPFLGAQELEVTAAKMQEGCLLTVRQGPYPENAGAEWDWFYEAVVDAWPQVLRTLQEFLEK
ncbi:MAG: SRPBCC family protein [Saprospiraceae bacterium]